MVLSAVQGALGFLSSIPVGRTAEAWEAFSEQPAVIPLVGYVVGGLALLPFLLPVPPAVTGFLFVLAVYLATGINHLDGLLDVADGVATHGDAETAREAMKDSAVGVGAVVSLGIVLLGLFSVGQTLTVLPFAALGIVVAAEVGAKLAMTAVIARGEATHEGLGQTLAENAGQETLIVAFLLSLPAAALTWPHPAGALVLLVGLGAGIGAEWFARERFGGINGDVAGATNEVARLLLLGVGVIAWTL